MRLMTPPILNAPKRSGNPSPAVPEGCEDVGQRELEDTRGSDVSDNSSAGSPLQHRHQRSLGEANASLGVVGDLDRTFPVVPGKGMETPPRSGGSSTGTRARRDVSVDVRMTISEREAVRARARAVGVKSSALVRAVVLDYLDARRGVEETVTAADGIVPPPELAQAVEQLRRVGVNLNQVLRRGLAADEELVGEVLSAVGAVRASLGDGTRL